MRLSEAIALGRTIIVPSAGYLYSVASNSGCALGMAGKAVYPEIKHLEYLDIISAWPWANDFALKVPCQCGNINGLGVLPALSIITHLFDLHVELECDWTLDQLIDWVRSVEPNEPEESPAQQPTTEAAGLRTVEKASK